MNFEAAQEVAEQMDYSPIGANEGRLREALRVAADDLYKAGA